MKFYLILILSFFSAFIYAQTNSSKGVDLSVETSKNIPLSQGIPFLFINEFMADNNFSWADEAGEFDDWVEIYNGGSVDISLQDKFLSDDHSNPGKWRMPDVVLEAGAYLLFWCDEDQPQGTTHTNFRLNKEGEQLGIWDSLSTHFAPIDTFTYGAVTADTPWGLYPNGSGDIMQLSWRTPGYSNVPLATTEVEKNQVKAFPNPVNVSLTIHAPDPIEAVEIIAVSGKTRWIKGNKTLQMDLDLSDLAAGVYTLYLQHPKGNSQVMIVKQ